jgi:hypothetical protein
MNLSDMRTIVRRDLHDEDSANYRWTDDELSRHIQHAVKEFSASLPLEQKAQLATVSGSREINIAALANRIAIEAVEYPVARFPAEYQRFTLWGDMITLLGDFIPDGSNCTIFYGKIHTLDSTISTLPVHYEDVVVAGAAGFAAMEWAMFTINRVNTGGDRTAEEFLNWGKLRLEDFRWELKKLSSFNRVRVSTLYEPIHEGVSQTTDYGP